MAERGLAQHLPPLGWDGACERTPLLQAITSPIPRRGLPLSPPPTLWPRRRCIASSPCAHRPGFARPEIASASKPVSFRAKYLQRSQPSQSATSTWRWPSTLAILSTCCSPRCAEPANYLQSESPAAGAPGWQCPGRHQCHGPTNLYLSRSHGTADAARRSATGLLSSMLARAILRRQLLASPWIAGVQSGIDAQAHASPAQTALRWSRRQATQDFQHLLTLACSGARPSGGRVVGSAFCSSSRPAG